MAEASIPVDLLNPGHVFACLGFLEAADILLGNPQGGFDWIDEADIRFRISADGDSSPVQVGLSFLAEADVHSLAPHGTDLSTEKWNVTTRRLSAESPFPYPAPDSPAKLPAVFNSIDGRSMTIDHWGDSPSSTSRDNVKFWAGAGDYPGAALARDGMNLVRDRVNLSTDDGPRSGRSGKRSPSNIFPWPPRRWNPRPFRRRTASLFSLGFDQSAAVNFSAGIALSSMAIHLQ